MLHPITTGDNMTHKKATPRTFIDGKPTPAVEVGFGKIVRAVIRTETRTWNNGDPETFTYLQTQVKTDNGWRDDPGTCGSYLTAMIMEMLTDNA
mgnify:CR=1 FL=1|tara:strand:- start:292 stop:573 length:282 start_codon:yes stop_codon:yes gene_type:complete